MFKVFHVNIESKSPFVLSINYSFYSKVFLFVVTKKLLSVVFDKTFLNLTFSFFGYKKITIEYHKYYNIHENSDYLVILYSIYNI